MEHRDAVILQKVLSEIKIAENMVGDRPLAEFIGSEMLKRAVCMTVINIGELVKISQMTAGRNTVRFPGKRLQVSGTLRPISIKR